MYLMADMPLCDRLIFLAQLLIVLPCIPSLSGSFEMRSLLFQRRPHSSLELVKEFFNRTLLPACDLTANACDIDCCNDMDCSEDEIQSFRCSKNVDPTTVDPIFADPYYCYGESYLAPVNPVLCYEIENSPYLGRYFLEEKTAGTKKHLESRLEALSVRGLNIFTDQLPLPVPADREPYRYGSPLRYAGGELLTIPTSLLGKGSCSAQVVRYLLDVDNVCNSYADPASCVTDGRFQLSSFLSGDSAEKLWLADIQSGNSRTSVDSAVAVYCGRTDRPFSGYVECDDLPSIMKTRYDRAANACENVVTQLRFDLKWFENRLTLANVTVLLSTVSLSNQLTSVPSRKRSRPTIWQHFQVKYRRDDSLQTMGPAGRPKSYRLNDKLYLHHVQ